MVPVPPRPSAADSDRLCRPEGGLQRAVVVLAVALALLHVGCTTVVRAPALVVWLHSSQMDPDGVFASSFSFLAMLPALQKTEGTNCSAPAAAVTIGGNAVSSQWR